MLDPSVFKKPETWVTIIIFTVTVSIVETVQRFRPDLYELSNLLKLTGLVIILAYCAYCFMRGRF